ncbi:hypothetical protein [Micromonospora olivasterospora]|uniref:Uncharacterized protein n=1 Tax=Micromonospora olivasterospora TaxID=1880 RepID=A0A562ICP0_MICOL|nr:hypothetical protein [Micromonospora olivasterospora]TWH68682.1 hypothetical protein JD77_03679 [Micromonospora olivasterospora]
MQPVGPYRFTETIGTSQVGKAWWAVDGQDRLVTVAVLDTAVAEHPGWRRAFSGMADALAAPGGGGRSYLNADFDAPAPWVAYAADGGPGAEHLFKALGHPIRAEHAVEESTVAMLQLPVRPVPAPDVPPASQADPSQPQSVSGPPRQVSAPPQQVSGLPYQVSGLPQQGFPLPQTQPVSGPPHDPFASPVPRIQPSEPPRRRTGLWIGIAALVLLVLAGAGGVFVWYGSNDDGPAQVGPRRAARPRQRRCRRRRRSRPVSSHPSPALGRPSGRSSPCGTTSAP